MAYPIEHPDPTKVVGRRVAAVLLDAIIVIVPAILLLTSSFEYLEEDDLPVDGQEFCDQFIDDQGGQCVFIDDRVYFNDDVDVTSTAYYWGVNFLLAVLLQAFTGWTPGKLIMGIRVVREEGRPPGLVKAFIRWVLWIVDGFPYFIPGLTGFIVASSTPGHRRVGDMAASTFVVRKAAAGTPLAIVAGRLVVGGGDAAPTPTWGTPAPVAPVATTGWAPPTDPNASGWASPSDAPVAPGPAPGPAPAAAPTPGTDAPQWDAARNTYIQWDPVQQAWMQWDEGFKAWSRIPGQ